MKVFYYDQFHFSLPENHRFPLNKYKLLRQQIEAERLVSPSSLVVAPRATLSQIERAHDADYIEKVEKGLLSTREIRRIGIPWSPELVERVHRSVGSTIAVCRMALKEGTAVSLGGGTHHACTDHGEGFCIYNDTVIAARTMQAEGRAKRIIIIDCDVHQGNGTAQITHNDATIYTFSIHSEKNFPFRKFPSNLDVGLPDGTEDTAYLEALQTNLIIALEQAQADLAIYLAGADPFIGDRLGRLNISKRGLAHRDQYVISACQQRGIPIAITMAGGYGKDIRETVGIYAQTVDIAIDNSRIGQIAPASDPES